MAQNIPREWATFTAREKKVTPKKQKGAQRQPCWLSVLFKQGLNSWLFVNGWDLAVSSRRLQSTQTSSLDALHSVWRDFQVNTQVYSSSLRLISIQLIVSTPTLSFL